MKLLLWLSTVFSSEFFDNKKQKEKSWVKIMK